MSLRPEPIPSRAHVVAPDVKAAEPVFADYCYGVARRARRILAMAALAGVAAAVFALLHPSWYAARCTFLPSRGESRGPNVTMLLNRVLGGGAGLTDAVQAGDLTVVIMRSEYVRQQLVEEFDLVERYEAKTARGAAAQLLDRMRFFVGQEGLVTVWVEDRDPELAAQLANRTVALLDRFNAERRMTDGRRTRLFVERELAKVSANLAAAEDSLQTYVAAAKSVPMAFDSEAMAAQSLLISRRMELEIQLDMEREVKSDRAESVRLLQSELDKINEALGELPEVSLEYARLLREVSVQENLYELLRANYEEAKVREAEDTQSISVVDQAQPPTVRSRPRRKLMVASAAGAAGFLALLWALIATYFELLPPGSRHQRLFAATGHELRRLLRWPRRAD